MHFLLTRIADGMGEGFPEPLANASGLQIHGLLLASHPSLGTGPSGANRWNYPFFKTDWTTALNDDDDAAVLCACISRSESRGDADA